MCKSHMVIKSAAREGVKAIWVTILDRVVGHFESLISLYYVENS